MIRSHISFTQDYVVVLKFERLSHLLGMPFRLGSLIRLKGLLLMLSLRVDT